MQLFLCYIEIFACWLVFLYVTLKSSTIHVFHDNERILRLFGVKTTSILIFIVRVNFYQVGMLKVSPTLAFAAETLFDIIKSSFFYVLWIWCEKLNGYLSIVFSASRFSY